MSELIPLSAINWNSHTCECEVEPRRYVIERTPSRFMPGPVPQIEPERVWCHLHRLDGSVEEIPMRVTTIEEMVKSGLQPDYWADARRRQIEQIARTEDLVSDILDGQTPLDRNDPAWLARFESEEQAASAPAPRDLDGWQGYLARVRHGKTYADHEGYRRSPGSQTRGHLSHRCARHHNQTSTSLMAQRWHKPCGCVVDQITVGERREEGVNHERWVEVCPLHRAKVLAA